MGYIEWAPPPSLRGVVACLWRSTLPERPSRVPMPILPDGCVDLIWQSGHGAFLAGPDTRPVPNEGRAGREIVGVRLRPGAGGTVLGMPLEPLQNLRPGLGEVVPGLVVPAEVRAGEALRRLIVATGRLARENPVDPAMLAAARMLRDPRIRVDEVAVEVGLSDRQLRRRFTAAVGYGPKTLQRIYRFRRYLAMVGEGSAGELAVRAGYTDQAHLSRETVEFAGLPPAALARRMRRDQGSVGAGFR
ncbi:Urease operon transcriptional activator [Actinoplanes sp. SE50]|uniref:helix-turn-helix domain-containing protein n=1 Tax=unclassified Actinoplanes TaxID=2626549 RepID=UPI00023ED454|nr:MULTISPECIES: AraC family transcriptional regulator [unclassified Actinoplanes]AEV84992.1 Urease operon transcriptional activator [Actinoplanes sp. SE50/110]ATO83383.1 Urease operon transcriptional activator [Actinoplanes sp. SE50]SLM00790.1 Urease operon transcriptional activator [Actinoplanes sp. SE50/110]